MPEPSLRARAMSFLTRREYARAELYRKLLPYAEDRESLESLLDDLKARGWLSEQRFVEQIVHARQGKYGSLRVANELREKGVAEELIGAALVQVKEGELETARAIWQRKFRNPPADAKERAKQMRFLQSRGFNMGTIRRVMQGNGDEDE
ncbi:recombination regulator RecX [Sulfurirhabdus autotrophica]|uniref:Regulatory protein RecX n=1 Tax=Sulfurirhabdus autotrophica TaxID=1706046 RepID=A0A4R3Y196_9PROT|nr:recombination regulator RecX [Sulfurirhabdus autotrophica]TCV85430.1 regulatory protein [Sulfurirhabdus autotrophica]